MCCSNGKVCLQILTTTPPEPLKFYLFVSSPHSVHFLNNTIKDNSCYQMNSFGAKRMKEYAYMPTFKIQGLVYHITRSLFPSPKEESIFLQIYFMRVEERELTRRCEIIPGTQTQVILEFQRFLHEHNSLVSTFCNAIDNMPTDEYKMVIRANKTLHG